MPHREKTDDEWPLIYIAEIGNPDHRKNHQGGYDRRHIANPHIGLDKRDEQVENGETRQCHALVLQFSRKPSKTKKTK